MLTQTDIRLRLFSYDEFRKVTALSKKEADTWVGKGLIRARLAPNGRRRLYRFDSLVDGVIGKQLADFASRQLLSRMMVSFRKFLVQEGINLTEVLPNPTMPRLLVRMYTQKSHEIMPGGGVRGVITYVKRFDPSSSQMGKEVYLVLDLTGVVLRVATTVATLDQE